MATNPKAIVELDEKVKFERQLSRYPLLVQETDGQQTGIMTAAEPARPHARNARNHVEGCPKKDCNCPPKMTAAQPAKLSRKRLAYKIVMTARAVEQLTGHEIELFLTDGAKEKIEAETKKKVLALRCTNPALDADPTMVSTDESNYSQVAPYSEEIRQYAKREEWGQIEKQYTGRMFWDYTNKCSRYDSFKQLNKSESDEWFDREGVDIRPAPIIRFGFWPLVSSGRTGSRASALYPSMNGQNVDPRARGCFRSRDGHVLLSQDIVGLELISISWRLETLGISSVLSRLVKAGEDTHGYLGASLAEGLADEAKMPLEFLAACRAFKVRAIDRFGLYKEFAKLKKAEKKADHEFWKLWRTFAKPVGLGAWGALGAAVMHLTANSEPYHLDVTLDQCKAGLEIWRECYPEHRAYFNSIKAKLDLPFCRVDPNDPNKKREERYKYESPLGMLRRNVNWNETCNGNGLQTPSAEAMLVAIFNSSRSCRDWTQNSLLYGSFFVDFIHDEILLDIPLMADYDQTIARVQESERILKTSLPTIFTGYPIGVESVLMYSWDKYAEMAFDEKGRLVPNDTRPTP